MDIRPSSVGGCLICLQLSGRWRRWRRILRCRIRRSITGAVRDKIDSGLEAGPTSVEKGELGGARRRIRELETELAVTKRAIELLRARVVSPEEGTRRSAP